MKKPEVVLILDFGGQHSRLRPRVREPEAYCEVHPRNLSVEQVKAMAPAGVSDGRSCRCNLPAAPSFDLEILNLGVRFLASATVTC